MRMLPAGSVLSFSDGYFNMLSAATLGTIICQAAAHYAAEYYQ